MRRSLILLAVVAACGVGCGESESASSVEDEMVGTWVSNLKGIYVVFNADGTYGKGRSADRSQRPYPAGWSCLEAIPLIGLDGREIMEGGGVAFWSGSAGS